MINVCIINAKVSQCYSGIDQFAVITNCSNEVNDGCVVSINIFLRNVLILKIFKFSVSFF